VARALAATVGYNVFGLSAMIILRFFVTAAYFIYILALLLWGRKEEITIVAPKVHGSKYDES
jgi:hypothetical protein